MRKASVVRPGDAVMARAIEVTPRENEMPERMIKRFSKKVRDEGIIKEFAHRTYFEKPSVVRRRERAVAKWNARRSVRK